MTSSCCFIEASAAAVTVDGDRYPQMLIDFLWSNLMNIDREDIWIQNFGTTAHFSEDTVALRQTLPGGNINCPP